MAEVPSVELIPARSQPAVVIQMDPDLETPLLGPLEVPKSQSRIAPLIVLLAFILIVIALASTMGKLSFRQEVRNGNAGTHER